MPRGFLVKRFKKCATGANGVQPPPAHQNYPEVIGVGYPDRVRRYSDGDRSDTSSDGHPETGNVPPNQQYLNYSNEVKVQDEPLELTSPRKFINHHQKLDYHRNASTIVPSPEEYCNSNCSSTIPEVIEEKYNVAVVTTEKRASKRKKPGGTKTPRKNKATRRLNFDEDKSSPVSGTFIRDLDSDEELAPVRSGDIDPSLNVVVVSEEARAELAKIENLIGDYVCQLCKESYSDAFGLAQHRCSRIVHVEYRCPDCEKVFNCPANLASHRRWHKPKGEAMGTPKKDKLVTTKLKDHNGTTTNGSGGGTKSPQPPSLIHISLLERHLPNEITGLASNEGQFECELCGKKFRRRAYLRKHVSQMHDNENGNGKSEPPTLNNTTLQREQQMNAEQHYVRPDLMENLNLAVLSSDCRCAVCGALFANRATLEKHLRLHTNEVFNCKFCNCNFFSSSALTRHINNYHPSENREVVLLQMPPLRSVTS